MKPTSLFVVLLIGFAAGIHVARQSTINATEIQRFQELSGQHADSMSRLSEQAKADREIIESLVDRLRDRGNPRASTRQFHASRMIEL
jgi:hypothetical protein